MSRPTLAAARSAAYDAYVQARNDYEDCIVHTQDVEKTLECAKLAEEKSKSKLNQTQAAFRVTYDDLERTRANKFMAVVNASGITTRIPSAGGVDIPDIDSNMSILIMTESGSGGVTMSNTLVQSMYRLSNMAEEGNESDESDKSDKGNSTLSDSDEDLQSYSPVDWETDPIYLATTSAVIYP